MNPRGGKRREFPQSVRKAAFKRCCGKDAIPRCEGCTMVLRAGNIIFEHVQPDGLQGGPSLENCKVHCKTCADVKTFTEDNPRMAKADAVLRSTYGLKPVARQQIRSRGFAKSPPQNNASRPLKRKF